MAGKVYLIGAGPGDPRLLTLRAVEVLQACNVVLVDELVDPRALAYARGARVVQVGKRCGGAAMSQPAINELLVSEAKRGAIVARLKGGDPFVFGRGGEEALALACAHVPFEVVPGVSAAFGVAAVAGIPLTLRGIASSVALVTGHGDEPIRAVADTLVIYMCQRTIVRIARELIAAGRAPTTPIALARGATWDGQSVHVGQLGELAALPDDWDADLDPELPTLAIVGDVAVLARALAWRVMPRRLGELRVDALAAAGGAR